MPMYCFDLNAPFNLRIDEIQSKEFVYFKLPETSESGLENSIEQMAEALTKQSSKVFLASSNYSSAFVKSLINKYDFKWAGLALSSAEELNGYSEKWIPQISMNSTAEKIAETTLTLFQKFSLPFVFFDVEGAPDKARIDLVKKVFSILRKNNFRQKIYFSFNNPYLEEWNLKSQNIFSGLTTVHLDLSNKCTHSCVFCGIWGPDFIEEMKSQSNGQLTEQYKSFINRQMPFDKTEEILNSIPETVQKVQFGGAGDPLTHPQWYSIIKNWRERGLIVEVLTNFEYPSFEEIEALHSLSRGRKNFSFLINVSAATAEVYKTIRPRQSEETFKKVLANIQHAHKLRVRDGYGLALTIVNIINSQNYKEAVAMVELAHALGVGLWLKPVELHSDIHHKYAIPSADIDHYRDILKAAAKRAVELNVELALEDMLNEHIQGDEDLYKKISCSVGYTYARFEVDGTLRPCCISPQSMGNVFQTSLGNVWNSSEYEEWRKKFLQINETHFHLKDESYNFCKMCPHIPLNRHADKLLNKVRS